MIKNKSEVCAFFQKIAVNKTILFTNGNDTYIPTLINNLITSYKKVSPPDSPTLGVFCTDKKAYENSVKHNMSSCLVQIPDLGIDSLYKSNAGSEHYLRLCFVKIILIKYALELGYNILYIDPDMSFNKNCIQELLDLDKLTFAKYIEHIPYSVNTNIIRAFPEDILFFDFHSTLLPHYISLLPDVSDETFVGGQIKRFGEESVHNLSIKEFPAGKDSHLFDPNGIKMYHANGFVGLENKIEYLKRNNVWFI